MKRYRISGGRVKEHRNGEFVMYDDLPSGTEANVKMLEEKIKFLEAELEEAQSSVTPVPEESEEISVDFDGTFAEDDEEKE